MDVAVSSNARRIALWGFSIVVSNVQSAQTIVRHQELVHVPIVEDNVVQGIYVL